MIAAGFENPVMEAQSTFRAIMDATASPGRPIPIAGIAGAPRSLLPSTAAIVLTLLDHDAPLWIDDPADDVLNWIRFHTSAPIVTNAADAAFAIVTHAQSLPPLASFNPGTLDYPDVSTTVIVQVETLTDGVPLTLAGPGIKGRHTFAPAPTPSDLTQQLGANRALFPRGIDLLFVSASDVAALPRSVRVVEGG
jgi:alpha-D-ribose 1-methylphosphonate 5-triphosphate synthase subunit PhnH